jgi:hypothetical protein
METEATSLGLDAKEASYRRGYDDCKKSNDKKKSSLLSSYYAPVTGYEAEYQAGWDKAQAEEDKKIVRGAGVGTLVMGAAATVSGAIGLYVCIVLVGAGVVPYGLMALFAIFIFSGLGLLVGGLVRVISGRDVGDD